MFEDLIAMVALYRPGPMQFIDSHIARKHGKKRLYTITPWWKMPLKSTYGVTIYQEQVMQISRELGGLTGGEADTLRKAMGKKNSELMMKFREKILAGAAKNGVPANTIQKNLARLAALCRICLQQESCHLLCPGGLSDSLAEAHYPVEFMAALLSLKMIPALYRSRLRYAKAWASTLSRQTSIAATPNLACTIVMCCSACAPSKTWGMQRCGRS